MVAEVRVGSNQSLLIALAAEAIRGLLRSLKPKSVKKTAQEHTRNHKGVTGRTCWIQHKDHTATDPMDQYGEDREGRLRELSVRWFMDTQAPLILRNGIFPSWFQGFITRKDAEKTLHDKELGSFLIRLSDKTTGYILSYKGNGRCRHFMISQTKAGQLVVSGDTRLHDSLVNLIAFYKKNSIEPFGEYLTCLEECAEELYDMIQVSHHEKPPVNPRARTPATAAPQSRQDHQETPPLPRRRRAHVDVCGGEAPHAGLGGRAPAESAPGRAAWLETENTSTSAASSRPPLPLPSFHLLHAASVAVTSATEPPRTVYSLLQPLEAKSASPPLLLDSPSDGDAPHRLSAPPPRPSPRSSSPGAAQGQQRGKLRGGDDGRAGGSSRPAGGPGPDHLCASPVYYLAGAGQPQARLGDDERPAAVGSRDCAYGLFDDDAYELVPEADGPPRAHGEPRRDSHTYESPEDIRPLKPLVPSAGAKNDKWKWFPELKRK